MSEATAVSECAEQLPLRATPHAFIESGLTNLCCARSGDDRNPCARDRADECHFAEFPIYQCTVSFERLKGEAWERDASWMGQTALRDGRDDVAAVTRYVDNWIKNSERYEAVRNVSVAFRFVGFDTWIQGWFSHWTFDTGLSDSEAVASFVDFVDRKEIENEHARGDAANWRNGYFVPPHCLMGAEDRWRWCSRPEGTSLIGSGEASDAVPCRCDRCKSNGVVRIDH